MHMAEQEAAEDERKAALVHFSAQLERFLWDQGVRLAGVWGLFRGC